MLADKDKAEAILLWQVAQDDLVDVVGHAPGPLLEEQLHDLVEDAALEDRLVGAAARRHGEAPEERRVEGALGQRGPRRVDRAQDQL